MMSQNGSSSDDMGRYYLLGSSDGFTISVDPNMRRVLLADRATICSIDGSGKSLLSPLPLSCVSSFLSGDPAMLVAISSRVCLRITAVQNMPKQTQAINLDSLPLQQLQAIRKQMDEVIQIPELRILIHGKLTG